MRVEFPNKGIVVTADGDRAVVKNTIPGQKVSFLVNKVRRGKAQGRLVSVLEKSPLETESPCPHFGECGGCTYQSLSYEEQLKIKEGQVRALLNDFIGDAEFGAIRKSPKEKEYRNKMEFSFGDLYKDGPLSLGMHKRGSFYDIVTVKDCQIVDSDFREILTATLHYFREENIRYFHRMQHTGYLRHLLVRKAVKTGEILVDLVTTTQDWQCTSEQKPPVPEEKGTCPFARTVNTQEEERLLHGWTECLAALRLKGSIRGILHTKNDSVADMIKNEGTDILYGEDFFYEELLGLRFKISPFYFLQTK